VIVFAFGTFLDLPVDILGIRLEGGAQNFFNRDKSRRRRRRRRALLNS